MSTQKKRNNAEGWDSRLITHSKSKEYDDSKRLDTKAVNVKTVAERPDHQE